MGQPYIHELIPEVFASICDYLSVADLLSIRLASKELHNKSLYSFASRVFTYVILFLHPTSLTEFNKIASDAQFRKHVKYVTVSTDRVFLQKYADKPKYQLVHRKKLVPEAVSKLVKSQAALEEANDIPSILATTLKKLPNLQSVGVTLGGIAPIANKLVEGFWRPAACGTRMLSKQMFSRYVFPISAEHRTDLPDKATGTVLEAMELLGRRDLQIGLNLIEMPSPDTNRPFQEAREFHQAQFPYPREKEGGSTCQAIIQNVQISYAEGNMFYDQFLHWTTELGELAIHFNQRIAWPFFRYDVPMPFFAKLTKLYFSHMLLPEWHPDHGYSALVAFFDAHKNTLQDLELDWCHICGPGSWKRVIQVLRDAPKLTSLHLTRLSGHEGVEASTDDDFGQYGDTQIAKIPPLHIKEDRRLLHKIFGVLLTDFRTVVPDEDTLGILNIVDFRKCRAVLEGKVKL